MSLPAGSKRSRSQEPDAYNRDGSLASETYSSGRVASHTYNRLGQSATLTSGGSTLVSSVSHYGHGGISALAMGNGLTEQTCYNTRLQPTIRRLGTGTQSGCANGGDKLNLTFDWGAAGSNNGNLKGQTIAVPGFSQTQYYECDATNRLKIAVEAAPVPGVADLPGDFELAPRVQLRPLR